MSTEIRWRRISLGATRLARHAAKKRTLTATVHESAPRAAPRSNGQVPPAWFEPNTGQINVITDVLGVTVPTGTDLYRALDRLRNPVLAGALLHEAAHAAHTRWTEHVPAGTNGKVLQAAKVLEEARIEGRMVSNRPADQISLRASATQVTLLAAPEEAPSPDVVASILGLVLPRVDARILRAKHVTALKEQARALVTTAGLREFESIWLRALDAADDDAATMLACGRDWLEATRKWLGADDDEDNSDDVGGGSEQDQPDMGKQGEDSAADDADDAGNAQDSAGTGASGGEADTGGVALPSTGCGSADAAPDEDAAAESASDDGADDDDGSSAGGAETGPDHDSSQNGDHDETSAAGRALRAALRDILDDTHEQAHQQATPAQPDSQGEPGRSIGIGGASTQITYRAPGTPEHMQRAVIVRHLKDAQYQHAHRIPQRLQRPTGKLSMGRLMQLQAQQQQQQRITAQPWTKTALRITDKPPLHVGIVLDISGTMEAWAPAAGTAAWILAHAVNGLGGSAAATAFSGSIYPMLAPGSKPSRLPVVTGALGGSDGCALALDDVAGKLALTARPGARLVVVLTDGELPDKNRVERTTHQLLRAGVNILWAMPQAAGWSPTGAQAVPNVTPETFAHTIGRACADLLRKHSPQH